MPAQTSSLLCYRMFVSGKVQGVFFRKYTQAKARKLNIKGWVRNCEDGRVEIFAIASKLILEEFTQWIWKEGSPKSQVTDVSVSLEDLPEGDLPSDFVVRR